MSYYCCDSCMRIVHGSDVEVWADFEHVVCKRCIRKEQEYYERGEQ